MECVLIRSMFRRHTSCKKDRPAIIKTFAAIVSNDCGSQESTGQKTDGGEAHFFSFSGGPILKKREKVLRPIPRVWSTFKPVKH